MARRDEPEFESGQMVIDKRRCWRALQLTMFFNTHSDFFYHWLLGDKDTFHMAWRRIGQPYGMPMFRPEQDSEDGPVLYQHDFQGRRLFQHRNQDKWNYDGGNLRIPAFRHEEACLESVRRLQKRWDGVVRQDGNLGRTDVLLGAMAAARVLGSELTASFKRPVHIGIVLGELEVGDIEYPGLLTIAASRRF